MVLRGKGKRSRGRGTSGGGVIQKGKDVYDRVTGKRKKGTKRRTKSPAFWANKVLVEKLKRRYHKLKYGGLR